MSTQSERFAQIVRALAEEGESFDPTLDDSAKLRWYRSQAVAALELPADGSKRQRCHSGHESPAALWNCPVCTDHKVEFYDKLEAAGMLGAAEILLQEPGLLSTLKIDPSTVEDNPYEVFTGTVRQAFLLWRDDCRPGSDTEFIGAVNSATAALDAALKGKTS